MLQAKRSGTCIACDEPINIGDDITGPLGEFRHIRCSDFTVSNTVAPQDQPNRIPLKVQNDKYRKFLHRTVPHNNDPVAIWHRGKGLGIHAMNECPCSECETYRKDHGVGRTYTIGAEPSFDPWAVDTQSPEKPLEAISAPSADTSDDDDNPWS